MHRAVGDQIRAIIAFLVGSEPRIADCAGFFGLDVTDWLKPIDSIVNDEMNSLKEEIAGVTEERESSLEENKCIESLLKLGSILAGINQEISETNHTYVGEIGRIECRDLAGFVLRCLYSMTRRPVEGKYPEDIGEGGIIGKHEEVLLKRIREHHAISMGDEWLDKLECLPYCGRVFEAVVRLNSILSQIEDPEVYLSLLPHKKYDIFEHNENKPQGILAFIVVLLARMRYLASDDPGVVLKILFNPISSQRENFWYLAAKEKGNFRWAYYVFNKPKINSPEYYCIEQLNNMPIKSMLMLRDMGFLKDKNSEDKILMDLYDIYKKAAEERTLLEYMVLSVLAQDGIPILPSSEWIIRPKERYEECDSLCKSLSGVRKTSDGCKTEEVDGLLLLNNEIVKRLKSALPSSGLEAPSYDAVGIIEVTAGEIKREDIDKLKGIVKFLKYWLGETSLVFGLIICGKEPEGDEIREEGDYIISANLEKFMQIEKRFNVYKKILKLLSEYGFYFSLGIGEK